MKKLIIACLILCILSSAVYGERQIQTLQEGNVARHLDVQTNLIMRGEPCPEFYATAYNISQEKNCKLEWIGPATSANEKMLYCKRDDGWFAIDITCGGNVNRVGYLNRTELIAENYMSETPINFNVIIGGIFFFAAAFILVRGITSIIKKRKQWDSGVNEGETAEQYLARKNRIVGDGFCKYCEKSTGDNANGKCWDVCDACYKIHKKDIDEENDEEDLPEGESEDEEEESTTPKKKGAIRIIPKKTQRVHDPISNQADKKDVIDNGGIKGW